MSSEPLFFKKIAAICGLVVVPPGVAQGTSAIMASQYVVLTTAVSTIICGFLVYKVIKFKEKANARQVSTPEEVNLSEREKNEEKNEHKKWFVESSLLTLDFDEKGSAVRHSHQMKIKCLVPISYFKFAVSNAQCELKVNVSPSAPVNIQRDGNNYYIIIEFLEEFSVGQIASFHVEYIVKDSYTQDFEFWEFYKFYEGDLLRATFKFPDSRPIKSLAAYVGNSPMDKKSDEKSHLSYIYGEDKRPTVVYESNSLKRQDNLTINWHW